MIADLPKTAFEDSNLQYCELADNCCQRQPWVTQQSTHEGPALVARIHIVLFQVPVSVQEHKQQSECRMAESTALKGNKQTIFFGG